MSGDTVLAIAGQIAGKWPGDVSGKRVRRGNRQDIRHVGEGHDGIKLVIAIRPAAP